MQESLRQLALSGDFGCPPAQKRHQVVGSPERLVITKGADGSDFRIQVQDLAQERDRVLSTTGKTARIELDDQRRSMGGHEAQQSS